MDAERLGALPDFPGRSVRQNVGDGGCSLGRSEASDLFVLAFRPREPAEVEAWCIVPLGLDRRLRSIRRKEVLQLSCSKVPVAAHDLQLADRPGLALANEEGAIEPLDTRISRDKP